MYGLQTVKVEYIIIDLPTENVWQSKWVQLDPASAYVRLSAGSPMDRAVLRALRELLQRKAERTPTARHLSRERTTVLQRWATVEPLSAAADRWQFLGCVRRP